MIRFALFGTGRAGRIHARNIARHPRTELAIVYDIDRPAAERLAERYGARAAADSAPIWAAASTDAVMIASSTDTHVDLLREALRAGKAAYCEKPTEFIRLRTRERTDGRAIPDRRAARAAHRGGGGRVFAPQPAGDDIVLTVGTRRRAPARALRQWLHGSILRRMIGQA